MKYGFNVEAEAESNKIRRLVRERLILEANELQHEINSKGIEKIKVDNPAIIHIIDNLDGIIREGEKWTIQ